MINIHLTIANPWYRDNFANLFCRSGRIGKHKAWEIELTRYAFTLFEFSFRWLIRDDHAGPTLELGLFGYSASVKIYDCRHWDHARRSWVVHED